MKNLVTGATGFIGSFIAENLVKKGEHVRALVRNTSDTALLKDLGVDIFYGDLTDSRSVKEAVKGMDKVFHSAAMVGDWMPRKEAYKVNVEGTRWLVEAAVEEKVERFIFVSSLAVLGMRDHHGTPDNAPRTKANDIYADTKIDSEALVEEYGRLYNLPFTIIRPGFVFGPRDKKVIPRMVDFIRRGKFIFIGKGDNKINMIYIENLADIIVKASTIDRAIGQIYNVTNDSGMTMKDLAFMVSDLWGLKRPRKHIPKKAAYVICNMFESFARLTNSKKTPLFNKTRLKFLSLNLDFDISKIKRELSYSPHVDMLEGLKRTKEFIEVGNKKG